MRYITSTIARGTVIMETPKKPAKKRMPEGKNFDVEPYTSYNMSSLTVRDLLAKTGHSWGMNLPSFLFTEKNVGPDFISYTMIGSIGHSNKYSALVVFHNDYRFTCPDGFIKITNFTAPENEQALVVQLNMNIRFAHHYTRNEYLRALKLKGGEVQLDF